MSSFRSRLAAVLLALFVVMISAGCWPAADGGGKTLGRSNSLRLGGWPLPPLDPAASDDAAAAQVTRLVFSGLMRYDSAMRLQPDLAIDFPAVREAITYTFTLREARFHDGRQIVADDVRYSLERACRPTAVAANARPCASTLGNIRGMRDLMLGRSNSISGLRVIDDLHLSIVLSDADASFLYRLAQPPSFIVDRDQVQSDPTWTQHPNGSGPYLVQQLNQEGLTLARFADYAAFSPKPDYIEFRASPNPQADFAAGKLDIIRTNDPADVIRTSIGTRLTYWGLNNRIKPFDDPLVRQAFARALDVNRLAPNGSVAAYDLLPPSMGGSATARFDLSAARQMLEQSSYEGATNLPPILIYSGNSSLAAQVATAISQNLGVNISVRNVEYSDLLTNAASYQSFIAEYAAPAATPSAFLLPLLSENSPANLVGYRNADVAEQLNTLAVSEDEDERAKITQQIISRSDTPLIPIAWQAQRFRIQPNVQGVTVAPWGLNLDAAQR